MTDACSAPPSIAADREVLDVLGEGEARPDERAVDDAVDGPVERAARSGIDDEDAEPLRELLDDGRLHDGAEDFGGVRVAAAEDPRQHEVDEQRDRDGRDRAPRDREDDKTPGLRLPAVDDPDREEHARERDEREDRAEQRRTRPDERQEVADERDQQEDEESADPDGGAAPGPPGGAGRHGGGCDARRHDGRGRREARLCERRREGRGHAIPFGRVEPGLCHAHKPRDRPPL